MKVMMKSNRQAAADAERLKQIRFHLCEVKHLADTLRPITRRDTRAVLLNYTLGLVMDEAAALHASVHFDATGELLEERE